MKIFYLLIILFVIGTPCMAQETEDTTITTYRVEKLPQFPGGSINNFLKENLVYPQKAIENHIEGKVYIRLIIDTSGNVLNPEVFGQADSSLAFEALRVVKSMPRWQPGYLNDKPVSVVVQIPITFKLSKEMNENGSKEPKGQIQQHYLNRISEE